MQLKNNFYRIINYIKILINNMEDNINTKVVETKIPIEQIINQTLMQMPKTECEFNNMLVYNAVKMGLEGLEINKDNQLLGGKRKRKTIKNNKRKYRNKLTKYKRRKMSQKGGANPQLIIFLIGLLLVFVKGITNTTDTEVIERIKQSGEVKDIYRNYYGTCSLNTMLFLKTIKIPTFEELSINMMKFKPGFNKEQMTKYMNQELDVKGEWTEINPNPQLEDESEYIQSYIDRLKNTMKTMRLKYGYRPNQSVITAMTYPVKNKEKSHAVVLWLTSEDDLILIDPQIFTKYGIEIYSSDLNKSYLDSNKKIRMHSLERYIREKININLDRKNDDYSTLFPTSILTSLHTEIADIYGKDRLSLNNKLLTDAIARIKNLDKELHTEKDEFREQL